ncbi:Protein zer-1-like protein [Acropora cervicornis]|uniref:Protein zer-1-like protein n=1 Tax=Acropora cervicornis TaxID=6130 RepID=A0AAD9QR43_ACRCE|nr:Protein zer-1-like protein [Acropora cervicornis]
MTKDEIGDGNVSSLLDMCIKSSLEYLESNQLLKNEAVFLPEDICEALICKKLKTGNCNDDFIATFFADVRTSRMTKAHLSSSTLTDAGIEMISSHPLREVDISKCSSLTGKSLLSLLKCKHTLVSLNIAHFQMGWAQGVLQHLTKLKNLDISRTYFDQREFESLETLVNLQRLIASGTGIKSLEPVRGMASLTTLDLSNCHSIEVIKPLESIKGTLCWLSLYNCEKVFSSVGSVSTLQELKHLQYLDLSMDDPDDPQRFSLVQPRKPLVTAGVLEQLLSFLPSLRSLDVSSNAKFKCEDLMLFNRYLKQKLSFLGLFMTDMCQFPEIPAKHSFEPKEEIDLGFREGSGLLCSPQGSPKEEPNKVICPPVGPPSQLSSETNLIILKSSSVTLLGKNIDFENVSGDANLTQIMLSMKLYKNRPNFIICALQGVFHITRERDPDLNVPLVCELVLNAMENHPPNKTIQLAGSASLYHLSREDDHENPNWKLRVIEATLVAMHRHLGEPQMCDYKRVVWLLLRAALEHQEDLIQRIAIGLCNLMVCQVQDSLKIVVGKELRGVERPENCALFIEHGGLHLFTECTKRLSGQRDLVRNMLGLMDKTIETWDITAHRQMSYRSFSPILKLIAGCDIPAIHHWSTWALANLCNVDAEKYCKLVRDEDGISVLKRLTRNQRTSPRAKELAQLTLDKCNMQNT